MGWPQYNTKKKGFSGKDLMTYIFNIFEIWFVHSEKDDFRFSLIVINYYYLNTVEYWKKRTRFQRDFYIETG